ncbi:glutamine synthetase beta-grasp domain-containing protein [Streptomyces europaeiscabiei]|uniref:glutamine synthetase beta-grasp domain-containing protein n=1 Tax=Streptomyces europaeiscabiei TaxID=146819 RepID=UPI0030E2D9F9
MTRQTITDPLEQSVDFVQLLFTDIAGRLKTLEVPASRWAEVRGQGWTLDGAVLLGYGDARHSDLRLVPDTSTLIRRPWTTPSGRAIAMVFCDVPLSAVPTPAAMTALSTHRGTTTMHFTAESTDGPVGVPSPDHEWTALFFITEPGIGEILPELAGCTTGLCSARDDAARFARAGVRVLGVSAHAPGHLADFARTQDLGYPLIGDGDLTLGRALGVPEVRADDRVLFARAAVILDRAGRIRALLHPVPKPEHHAALVLERVTQLKAAEAAGTDRD